MLTYEAKIDWKGPGYYRCVVHSRIDDHCICEWQKIASLTDHATADHARRKGRRIRRARSAEDLPTGKE